MAFPVGWTWRCEVTINSGMVGSGGVSDFSALLRIETSKLTNARVDRGDVRWSLDSAGDTQLAADYLYDYGSYAYWRVRVPSISSASHTSIYAWWGKSGETLPDPSDTYGRYAAYDSYWETYWPGHNDEDRTANGYDATVNSPATANATPAGTLATPAFAMNTTGWLTSTYPIARIAGESTVMIFAYLANQSETRITGVGNPNQWLISTQSNQRCHHTSAGATGVSTSNSFRLANTWMLLDLTWSGTTRTLSRDISTTSSASTTYASAGGTYHLGANPSGTAPTGGYYAHVSTHTSARSAAWRLTEYNAVLNPLLFSVAGTPEDLSTPPVGFTPYFYQRFILGGAR